MIMKEKIYIANNNLEIDIPNLHLMKSGCQFLTRYWMLLDKFGGHFASC